MSEIVKAVGFCFYPAEVVMIHFKYGRSERLHLFPPRMGIPFDISDESKKHVVLLSDIRKRHELRDHHERIHRLLVFAKPEDLEGIGIPCIDAVLLNGKVSEVPQLTPEIINDLIRDKAVDISLEPRRPIAAIKPEPTAKTAKHPLSWWLERIFGDLDEQHQDYVRQMVFHRIADQVPGETFREVCRGLRAKGVAKSKVRGLYRWVEGIEGDGAFLGKAVDHYFDPPKGEDELSIEHIAKEYDVDASDMRAIISAIEEIDEETD